MPRFLLLLAANGVSLVLFEAMRAVFDGSLDPAIVPLAAGLVAWSAMVLAGSITPVERRFTGHQRLAWILGGQLGLVLAVMQGAPLWRLPGGYSKYVVFGLLALPVAAVSHVTICALFTRAERDAWAGRQPRGAADATDAPTL
ncbi:hypothetical protein [Methylobacterium platani]|uniref:Uncharacterized protein n=2 Tax=Methylobacterium platani TaxID=427683 RepID=A0A179S7U1_9HYPH|nr:hypothetical protein [Methylobacterium platani]KMO13572.1 hypothetical protein SQ03_21545 [Methylobacterium platani JCM 14648]OAS20985.1 hypothetical protein A5481_21875 [Methylobacterium platani]